MAKFLRKENYIRINIIIASGLLIFFSLKQCGEDKKVSYTDWDNYDVADSVIFVEEEIKYPKFERLKSFSARLYTNYSFVDKRDGQEYDILSFNRNSALGGMDWTSNNLNLEVGGEATEKGRLYTYQEAVRACGDNFRIPLEEEWLELLQYFGGYALAKDKDTSKMVYYTTENTPFTSYENLVEGKYPYFDLSDREDAAFWTRTGKGDSAYVVRVDTEKRVIWMDYIADTDRAYCRCIRDSIMRYQDDEPLVETESFRDNRDNEKYVTTTIGSLEWMSENLAYESGDILGDSRNGYLYRWSDARRRCPSGWRLPTRKEIETLCLNYGGYAYYDRDKETSFYEGNYGRAYRALATENGMAKTYFDNNLGAALIGSDGVIDYFNKGKSTDYWTSTKESLSENGADIVIYRVMDAGQGIMVTYATDRQYAYCRCVRNK